jgi:hypothetical protein
MSVELYTASHAERRVILASDAVHVRISRGHPRGTPALPVIRELCPSRELLDQADTLDPEEWRTRYLAGLDDQAEGIARRLDDLAAEYPGRPLVLCCFERVERGERCHRTYFAEWWANRTGTKVLELRNA